MENDRIWSFLLDIFHNLKRNFKIMDIKYICNPWFLGLWFLVICINVYITHMYTHTYTHICLYIIPFFVWHNVFDRNLVNPYPVVKVLLEYKDFCYKYQFTLAKFFLLIMCFIGVLLIKILSHWSIRNLKWFRPEWPSRRYCFT